MAFRNERPPRAHAYPPDRARSRRAMDRLLCALSRRARAHRLLLHSARVTHGHGDLASFHGVCICYTQNLNSFTPRPSPRPRAHRTRPALLCPHVCLCVLTTKPQVLFWTPYSKQSCRIPGLVRAPRARSAPHTRMPACTLTPDHSRRTDGGSRHQSAARGALARRSREMRGG